MTESDIATLNTRFRLLEAAKIVAGSSGLPKIKISTIETTAEIYLHGAHVTSWQPAGNKEILFLSEQSRFEAGKAIRGGIPICLPWFGPKANDSQAPQHGFARTSEWQLDGLKRHSNAIEVTLSLVSSETTKQLWPHEFRAVYKITAGARLHLSLTVTNTGSEEFCFEEALHTYFAVGDATKIRITGLEATGYLDNRDKLSQKHQDGDITMSGPIDHIYLDTGKTVLIHDPVLRRRLEIDKQNSKTTVVWNPGSEGAAALADMADDEWKKMACVEAANAKAFAISLTPGQSHTMAVVITPAQEEAN